MEKVCVSVSDSKEYIVDAIISITPEGFYYRGKLVKDAGKAYKLFTDALEGLKKKNAGKGE